MEAFRPVILDHRLEIGVQLLRRDLDRQRFLPDPAVSNVDPQTIPPRMKWCERGELNPHELPHGILSPARLPVPPLSRKADCAFRELDDNTEVIGQQADWPSGRPDQALAPGTTASTTRATTS